MIDELNEAAKQNADELWRPCDWQPNWDDLYESFIAGAEWQKEQMMKDAEECELYWDGDFLAIDLNMWELGYSERDKVRIIILTKEEEK